MSVIFVCLFTLVATLNILNFDQLGIERFLRKPRQQCNLLKGIDNKTVGRLLRIVDLINNYHAATGRMTIPQNRLPYLQAILGQLL